MAHSQNDPAGNSLASISEQDRASSSWVRRNIVAEPKITSREYKIMLHPAQLQGNPAEIAGAAMSFWQSFRRAIADIALDADGRLAVEERRLIRFFDTSGQRLRRNDCILRERVGDASGEREVTLKFRHPDRYLAASRDVAPMPGRDARTKFEEDIKAPFQVLYSRSTTQAVGAGHGLARLDDACRLFPSLPALLGHGDAGEAIAPVANRTFRELVLTGAGFQICRSPRVEAKCALIVWHDASRDRQLPEVAEFSFRYGDDHEAYGGKSVRRAYGIFRILQESPALAAWVDPTGATKTALAYQ